MEAFETNQDMLDKIEGLLQENSHLKAALAHAEEQVDASVDFYKKYIIDLTTSLIKW